MPGYSRVHMLYRYGGIVVRHHRQLAPLHRGVSASVARIRRQPVDLVRRRGASSPTSSCRPARRSSAGTSANGRTRAATGITRRASSTTASSCCSTSASSRSASRSPITRSSSTSCSRMGLGALYSEGCSETRLGEARVRFVRSAEARELARVREEGLLRRSAGTGSNSRDPVYFRWYAEDRAKDVPEPHPLPSQYTDELRQGPADAVGQDRVRRRRRSSAATRTIPSVRRSIATSRRGKGPATPSSIAQFPLQLTSSHSRYSFHTYCDGKDSAINDIEEHRVRIDGYDYWVLRISADDAAKRGIASSRPRPRAQRPRRGDLRGRRLAARRARRREVLPGVGEFRSDRRRRARHRSRRLREHPDAAPAADQGDRRHGVELLPSRTRALERLTEDRDEEVEPDRRRGAVRELPQLHARGEGRARRQRLSRVRGGRTRRAATTGSASRARCAEARRWSMPHTCRRCAITATMRRA